MEDNKLITGDSAYISRLLGVKNQTVLKISQGERGKRNNDNQKRIKRAIELRTKQNKELAEFCRNLHQSEIVPKKVS